MIFDIDNTTSVKKSIEGITRDWFDANQIYWGLHSKGITNSSNFWAVKDIFFQNISDYLSLSSEKFIQDWNTCCCNKKIHIMAYHCTRSPNPQVIVKEGIIPINSKVISNFISESASNFSNFQISEEHLRRIIKKTMETDAWRYRSGEGSGPYFFLSLMDAQSEGKGYQKKGPEFWWVCVDTLLQYCKEFRIKLPCRDREKWREKIVQNSAPLTIHCQIPYSILPNQAYVAFCMLRSFFKFIDPEDNDSEVPCIDLKGNSLEPKYIIKIEQP